MFELDESLMELVSGISRELSHIDACYDDLYFNREKDLLYFKEDMLMSNMQLSYRWSNINYNATDVINVLWFSGMLTFLGQRNITGKMNSVITMKLDLLDYILNI